MKLQPVVYSAAFLMGLIFLGCSHPAPPAADPPRPDAASAPAHPTASDTRPSNVGPTFVYRPNPRDSADAHPAVPILVRLNVYQVTVPSRIVSRNEAFWKHLDESPAVLDPATHDVLDKNGIRVGIAPQSDWDYFHDILIRQHAITQMSGSAGERPTTLEVSLRPIQPQQDIYWYDSDSELSGQFYEWCEDILSIRFLPTPRRPGDVTVTVTPLLRSSRELIEYTVRGEEAMPHFKEVYPEYLFDLKLRAVIPFNSFMVVAPSPMARLKELLGHELLVHDGKGEQFDTIVLISPQAFRLDEPETKPATRE